ncbi:hypothetical protein PC41400_27115 [Paenibacillus chitinolyticus]|uniref:Uncharacterized protein n=1 Tax=Paenibacillus chitinolyticus TaxID=79263 RepID=A0A410X3H5_9BACL|nr:hypothetical protein [Paenibacillus chitinolyticus]MCY9592995.1 hypothetical protein [Paenibacillus chitinolyticus]MCY9598935.1 hypothetical protein [Paenibacillus chitinolyticus]QAV21147.1 hypothetical protein PC41400_27115 [Paenibacillus chitinolyticus]
MLLGSEYEWLSRIAGVYNRHITTGQFQFTENDYKLKFSYDSSLLELEKLIYKGYVIRRDNLIILDSIQWINTFLDGINKSLIKYNNKLKCEYDLQENKVFIYENNEKIKGYSLNFSKMATPEDEVINFVRLASFDFYIYWLDLLNDNELFEMFYYHLTNKLSKFKYDKRIIFDFLDDLETSEFNEIYETTLKEYFKNKEMDIRELTNDQGQVLKKFLLSDIFNAYSVSIHSCIIFVVKKDKKIEFISYETSEIYDESVIGEIEVLRNKLLKKVTLYRSLNRFNKNKVGENTQKTIQIASLLITPINILLLFGISKNISWIKDLVNNYYLYIVIVGVLIISLIGAFLWVIIPSIRLSIFKWKLPMKD